MSMTPVFPDAIFTGNGGVFAPSDPSRDALDPCVHCGSARAEAPEGVDRNGDAVWVFDHCWHCGFRPGINQTVNKDYLREQFDAFQQFLAGKLEEAAKADPRNTLSPPAPDEVAALREQIEALQRQINSQAQPVPTNIPTGRVEELAGFKPNTAPNIPDPTKAPSALEAGTQAPPTPPEQA